MILAVFDCNVLVSALGWGGHPRACLSLAIGNQVRLCVTSEIWEEYDRRIPEILAQEHREVDPRAALNELVRIVYFVKATPLGKQRSRDPKDDRYLACAPTAGAKFIVTSDRDLLDLEKPFGVAIVTPVQFLLHVRGQSQG